MQPTANSTSSVVYHYLLQNWVEKRNKRTKKPLTTTEYSTREGEEAPKQRSKGYSWKTKSQRNKANYWHFSILPTQPICVCVWLFILFIFY